MSQKCAEHLQNLISTDSTAFDQAAHHPYMLYYGFLPFNQRWSFFIGLLLCHRALPLNPLTFVVLNTLFDFTQRIAVIFDTAPGGLTLTMGFLAAEGTPQILAPDIARVGDKKDATMSTTTQEAAQMGLGSQNRPQQPIILQNQPGDLFPAIPVRAKLKMLYDLCCKKPRL